MSIGSHGGVRRVSRIRLDSVTSQRHSASLAVPARVNSRRSTSTDGCVFIPLAAPFGASSHLAVTLPKAVSHTNPRRWRWYMTHASLNLTRPGLTTITHTRSPPTMPPRPRTPSLARTPQKPSHAASSAHNAAAVTPASPGRAGRVLADGRKRLPTRSSPRYRPASHYGRSQAPTQGHEIPTHPPWAFVSPSHTATASTATPSPVSRASSHT